MGSLLVFLVVMLPPMLLGIFAQRRIKSNYKRWSEVPNMGGLSGKQVAEMILRRNNITDVEVVPISGALTDHYDPRSKKIALSEGIYSANSVAAAAVAAHEVGHAIQHARAYAPLRFRSFMAPAVAFTSSTWIWLLFAGMLMGALGLVFLAIALYSVAVLFHIITLPVEFDASKRAKQELVAIGVGMGQTQEGTKAVLSSAAMTYVAGALASLSLLLYYLYIFFGQR